MVSFAVCCASCDKAERLRAQQAEVDQKRSRVLEEIKVLEGKLRALGPAGMGSVEPIKKLAKEKASKAAADEAQALTLIRKWELPGRQVDELRTRAEAWITANQP